MVHYTNHILSQVLIKYVGGVKPGGSRFYPGVPGNPATFIFTGTAIMLDALLSSGDYINLSSQGIVIADDSIHPYSTLPGIVYDKIYTHLSSYNHIVPGAPGSVTATPGPGNSKVTISWATPTGAIAYNIKRALTGGTLVTLTAGTNVSGNSFVDTTPTSGTAYDYAVSASSPVGASANSTTVANIIPT